MDELLEKAGFPAEPPPGIAVPSFVEQGWDVLRDALADVRLSALGLHLLGTEVRRCLAVGAARRRGAQDVPRGELVVLCGPPRTGSTFLHTALAADPGLRSLDTVDARWGPRRTGSTIEETRSWLAALDRAVPELAGIHAVELSGPEECQAATMATFCSWQWAVLFETPAYQEWLIGADRGDAVREHLGLLGQLERDADWLLKSPFWSIDLDHLAARAAAPVRPVVTVRHPERMVASWLGLVLAVQAPILRRRDLPASARRWLTVVADLASRSLGVDGALVVAYHELLAAPVATVGACYDAWDRPLPAPVEAALGVDGTRPWTAPPELAMVGLTVADVRRAFDAAGASELCELPNV